MVTFFLRGMLIGLLFGIPAGAVGAMTVQRTWNYGIKAGLLNGLGSSVADCIYAWRFYWHLLLVGSSVCVGKHHEKQAEKRPFSDDEPNIWSDFVYVRHGSFYPYGNLVKKRT